MVTAKIIGRRKTGTMGRVWTGFLDRTKTGALVGGDMSLEHRH